MLVDNLRLCGLDHSYEKGQYIKGSANRIHRQATHLDTAIQKNGALGLAIALYATTNNSKKIIESVKTGDPRNLNNKRIRHGTVKKELLILAKDLIKIQRATNQIKTLNDDHKARLSEIQDYSSLMIKMALSKYERIANQKANLMILGFRYNQESNLRCFPREIIDIIIEKAFEVKVDAVSKKLTQELLTLD